MASKAYGQDTRYCNVSGIYRNVSDSSHIPLYKIQELPHPTSTTSCQSGEDFWATLFAQTHIEIVVEVGIPIVGFIGVA